MNLKQAWAVFDKRFTSLHPRERLLAALTAVALVLFVGWQVAVAPALQQADQDRQQVDRLAAEANELQQQLAETQSALVNDPNDALKTQQQQRQARLDRAQQRLEALAANLISPEGMVALLRQMLSRQDGLSLVSVAHAPAEAVAVSSDAEQQPGLYRHAVTLTLRGRYFDLVEYLQALEALDSRLGWSAVRYEVTEWPEGQLQIRLVTLSLSEEWLGV